ncbi:hypothetical protein ACROYT_G012439 [Oculina patagonica]
MSSTAAASRRLEGKVAVVTASTEGIGFAIAKQLARDGAKVMISSRKQDKVTDTVAKLEEPGCTVKGVVCHVAKPEHRKNLIKETLNHFGGIDILVSNAAANPTFGSILEVSEEAWDKIFDVNLKSAFLLAKDVIPLMEKRGGGSVVFVSSIGGFQPMQGLGAYSISKTALLGLTKVLSNECAHMGVRVNCVAPGLIKTRFSQAIWKNEALQEQLLTRIPMRRQEPTYKHYNNYSVQPSKLGESEDIGGAVSFLSSDEASYITGETLVIAGGVQSRL